VKASRLGVARGVALLAVGAALAASCLRDLGGPGAGRAQFALVPTFTGGGASVVDFDRLRVTVERGASSDTRALRTAVDTVIPFPAGTDSVELTLLVPLEAPSETFQVFIRFVTAAGDTVFRNDPYPQVVVALAGSRSAVLEAILIYVGVGFDATALTITTPATTLAFGETLVLAAVAVGAGGQPIPGTPVAWTSLDPAVVTVANAAVGLAVAGITRGTARIVATTPTGLADTLIVDVVPLPGQLQIVSGDGQFANAGGILPLPLRVRLTGSDGLGVIAPVRFRALTGGFPPDVFVVTDVAGFAELTVTLGPGLGKQEFEAGAPGVTAVSFTAYATTSVALPFVVFAGDSSPGASSGVFRVNGDGSDRTRISDLGRSGHVHPRQSRDHGRVAFGFVGGLGTNELLVTARTGDTLIGLVTDTSTRRPRWNADGTSLAFECGDGLSPGQDVCVIPDVTAPLPALNRIGDGGGKVFVTDFTGDRLDGPGSFAWDPKNPKRLIVVRDSMTAQSLVASRLWTVGFDGASPVPLSPPVLDGGKGLLRIDGPLDVTFDGATIVFSAFDPGGIRALYVIRDGTQLRQLTAGPNDWNPVLSPDGRRVLFLRDSGCSADYWLIDLEGTGERRVSDERFCDFDLSVLGHDWSPDGKDIVLAGSDGQGHTLIYGFPAGATDYLKDRRLIGRGVDAGGFVEDIQPSWRP